MGLAGYMPGGGRTAMTGTFFARALLSALNPKLYPFDLVLIENARPRLMLACLLRGGMGIPFAFLGFRPEGTKARLQHAQDWLMSHTRQLMAAVAIFAAPTWRSAAWSAC